MAFTVSTFVKFAGADALREHLTFRRLALADNIDSEADASALARVFKTASTALALEDLEVLHQDFERAMQFVDEDAQAVLRASCLKDTRALAELDRWPNDRARALAILRLAPHLFADAEVQLGVHKLLANRQLWSGFLVTSCAAPIWSDDRQASFEDAVRGVYSKKAGSPRRLRLEIDQRERIAADGAVLLPISRVTLFHEGDTNREAVFRADGEVAFEQRRPALMAALLFDPSTQMLEVASKGGKQVQQAVAAAFAQSFWSDGPQLTKLKPASFALQRLKAPTHLAFQPSDGLRSACLVGVVLKARGVGRLDVTLRHPDPDLPMSLWDVAEEQFERCNPLTDPAMLIVSVDIRFEFLPGSGQSKPMARTVKLSLGTGSNKARLCERHRCIVDKLLKQWGLTAHTTAEFTASVAQPAI